ncbi:MAG: protein translocase subunit SecD [Crocinitomicaceae bacterium]|nr:protein translocase subunit SecD [Crocinitomicaceae bacterium]
MRNKGFFWFLTILLTIICVYQLSFTWVANGVEKEAEKASELKVDEIFAAAAANGDTVILLPNSTDVDPRDVDARDLAMSAYINDTLMQMAETPVFPLFGSTFSEVKKRSLAFGLDLVGGMSVTMEISVPQLVQSFAANKNRVTFSKPYEAALETYGQSGGDFITIFLESYLEINPGEEKEQLVRIFNITDIDELTRNSTNDDVIAFLREREESSMAGVRKIMEQRINQFGVAQPNIQEDPSNNRLYIELPGVQDEVTVANKLKSTANLQFFEVFHVNEIGGFWQEADAVSRLPESEVVEADEEVAIEDTTVVVDPEVEDTTASEPLSLDDIADNTTSLDDLSGEGTDGEGGLTSLLSGGGGEYSIGFATAGNKLKIDRLLKRKDVLAAFPPNLALMWSKSMEQIGENGEMAYVLYPIKLTDDGRARVGGKDIDYAEKKYDTEENEITVNLRMTTEGSDKWARMTEENIGKRVAITMDSVVYSAPNVISAITGGDTRITGDFSINEAEDLAGLLNGGSLPAPCVIKDQTKIGPTIGAENSSAGLISFGIALLLVFVYMVFYYGKAGIIADIALFANILFIFGSLSSFGAVLTLAGIAGIVLTIGMAVDANVLIFERIREEQAAGKDLKAAIDTGFKKALSSIIDANVTTMLTAIVLKTFGSGPIESFATTLIIGIFTSVFAALVITRLCINWWMKSGKEVTFDTKLTKGAFKKLNINFVGKRKLSYTISAILVIGSLAAVMFRGMNLSVEFSGGRQYGVEFSERAGDNIDYIRENLETTFGDGSSVEVKTKSTSYYLEIKTNYLRSNEDANEIVRAKLEEGLAKSEDLAGTFRIKETRSVSASVSEELISGSTLAIIISLLIIFAYILMRFGRWQYSTGAIIAMVHDVSIVLGVFAIFHGILPFNMDVDQAFVAAILTVIGYSINDTVVVFDRIRENLKLHKNDDEEEQINKSLNSTLSRTINTSMTTFMVLLIIFLFGGAAIKGFIFALMIGVIVGTYSSLYIATPILIDFSRKTLKEDKKKIIEAEEAAAAAAAEAEA